ncbi:MULTISPECIES: 50S ribosomal protein L10 [Rhodospirillales]|uniref:Large ribosomal subunit protein uL10 n=2 Tax=Rhodospirillales TaxID=204441 RepID=RL10_RHOCS|nr:50S ribosomal protein L10 [Rhodospirillum centenum]B6IRP4.1 RecName: Full=Large ribosomal subunit protein uL10; AltName: Full=50S ribosomal protein L10 [Rhodospirillum centenum SW]ACI98130.1 ribosomal protein L10 [Rhodospirillum centenum SW]
MDRTQKEATVAALNSSLQEAGLIIVTKQSGMTVAEVTDLRRKMRAAGCSFKVTKNRLARIALKGTQFETLDGFFKGPTAIAYSKDPVAAAKVAVDYAKTNDKFQIVGGGLPGLKLDSQGVDALSKLPSLNELRASLLGMIQTPATRIAGVLQAPGGQVARVLAAYAKKDEAA